LLVRLPHGALGLIGRAAVQDDARHVGKLISLWLTVTLEDEPVGDSECTRLRVHLRGLANVNDLLAETRVSPSVRLLPLARMTDAACAAAKVSRKSRIEEDCMRRWRWP
jgi:hypothetical protein